MRRIRSVTLAVALLGLVLLFLAQPNLGRDATLPAGEIGTGAHAPGSRTTGVPRALAASEERAPMARGLVRDDESKAHLPGASLVLRDRHSRAGGTVIAVTTADSSGAFELPCRPGVVVEARAHGYMLRQQRLACEDGAFVDLRPGVVISGQVVHARDRLPVSGAVVTCQDAEFLPSSDTVESDASGAFVLGSCPVAALIIGARHPSGAPARKSLGARAAGDIVSDLILEIGVGRRLVGRVVDAGGSPVADADVVVLENETWDGAQLLRSGIDGSFEAGISGQMHVVGAVTADGRAARTSVAAGADDPKPLELRLPAWFTMTGRLVGDATDATVTARRSEGLKEAEPASIRERLPFLKGGGTFSRAARVIGDRFTFEGVEAGRFDLHAQSATAIGEVTANHDDTDIVIEMKPAARLSISIEYGGKPAVGAVQLEYADGAIVGSTEAGRFESPFGLPTGDYWVTFHPDGGPAPAPTQIVAEAGENTPSLTFSSQTHRVEGRVLDSTSSQPITGAKVSVISMSGMNPGTPFPYEDGEFVLTDSNGRFAVDVVALSDQLFFVHEEYESLLILAADAGTVHLSPGISEPRPKPKPRHRPQDLSATSNARGRSTAATFPPTQ